MPDRQDSAGDRRQRALVTGAMSGLGQAIAQQLARDGMDVIVHGRDASRGIQTVAGIERDGGRASFAAADLSEPTGIDRLAAAAAEIDVLVNNAGFSWFGATADLKPDTFNALFASNVRVLYFLVTAIAPGMAALGSGSIINASSMTGRIGFAAAAAYGATKGALESLTRAWAAEFSPRGVRVNAVAPGPVYTGGAEPERTTALGATILLGRAANPGEIAGLVSFLASPQASYLTGAVLAADAAGRPSDPVCNFPGGETMTLAVLALSIDCADAEKLAGFWAAALGHPVDPGATAESASVGAGDVTSTGPLLLLHQVPEPKTGAGPPDRRRDGDRRRSFTC